MRLGSSLKRSTKERAGFVLLATLLASLVWSLHSSASRFDGRDLKSDTTTADPSSGLPEPVQNPTPCCNDKPHLLVGTYYSVKNGFTAKLLLNNKGPEPLTANPALFSISGERFDAPPVTVDGQSFQMIDMSGWINAAGPQFEEGSIEVFHVGKDLVLGVQIYLVDGQHSLSFDEKLVETKTFKSSRLEGIWWMPSQKGEVRLALSNTSDSPLTVTVDVDGHMPQRAGNAGIDLMAHETRLLDVRDDVIHQEHGAMSRFGSISLQHSGAPGALLARAMVEEPSIGYSLTVQFSDPKAGKSSELQGVGLHLGTVGGESLTPIVFARNVGNTTTKITGRVPYTTPDGNGGVVPLPELQLASGEMAIIDVAKALHQHGHQQIEAIAGLEFEYSNEPGSVMISALSVSDSGNQVFRVPMWDVYAQRSATGGYPWHIEGNSSTMVYLKNAEERQQHYYLQLRYPGGIYSLGIKTIEAGQTVSYDLRKLRDLQVSDAHGRVIPLGATSGQVHWTKAGTETGMLIGRSEQVDTVLGISSSYACVNCCPDNSVNARLVPDSDSAVVSDSRQFVAEYQLTTCYGAYSDWLEQYDAEWSSTPDGLASVSVGLAQANAPGTATIKAEWYADHYHFVNDDPPGAGGIEPIGGTGSCELSNLRDHLSATATFRVWPQVTVNEVGFTGDYQITKWDGGTVIDNPDGTSPTWKSSGNPDLPVAYEYCSTVTMFATLGIDPSVSSTSAELRVKHGSDTIGTKDITISGTTTTITGISTTLALASAVGTTTPTFTWEISYDGGSHWFAMGNSGPHTMYWTYGAPLSPPFQGDDGFTYSTLYDLALQKACGYSNGSSDVSTIISRINSGVESDTYYNPANSIASLHPLSGYSTPAGIQCADETDLLRGLSRSIGIDGTVLFIWAGPDASTLTRYTIGSIGSPNGSFPSFRIIRAAHEGSTETNPHFRFHAVVSANGTWYDPSFGLSYSSLSFDETANNNTPQQVHSTRWSSQPLSSFVCPH